MSSIERPLLEACGTYILTSTTDFWNWVFRDECVFALNCSAMSDTCDPIGCSLPGSSVHGIFQAKNIGLGCHFLLQGIFLTQQSNLGLLRCRQTHYRLSSEGSPWRCGFPTNTTQHQLQKSGSVEGPCVKEVYKKLQCTFQNLLTWWRKTIRSKIISWRGLGSCLRHEDHPRGFQFLQSKLTRFMNSLTCLHKTSGHPLIILTMHRILRQITFWHLLLTFPRILCPHRK